MKRVGFIGLGLMGGPMARNVLKQGFPLTVYDVVRERVDVLVAVGAKAAASPGEVAKASDVPSSSAPRRASKRKSCSPKATPLQRSRDSHLNATSAPSSSAFTAPPPSGRAWGR